jgi:hypothetical protein
MDRAPQARSAIHPIFTIRFAAFGRDIQCEALRSAQPAERGSAKQFANTLNSSA